MKIVVKNTSAELEVLAIIWPTDRALDGVETQFSAFDGIAVEDFLAHEFDVVDDTIDEFVFADKFDERFFCLLWSPLSVPGYWQKVREFDPKAILTLREALQMRRGS